MNPIVIDLSHWNPTPNWTQLASAGTMGVIHKATEGTTYVDPTYGGREEEARAARLLWASYHFLKHGDVSHQMEHYVATVGPAIVDRAIIDYEDPECTLDDLEMAVGWLLDYGCEVTVYGSSHLCETLENATSPLLSRTSLWQARYSDEEPDVPSPWLYWSLWQYTDKAVVKGVFEPVDANEWNGNPDKLTEWFEGADAQTSVPELPVIDIKIDVDRDFILYINGRQVSP